MRAAWLVTMAMFAISAISSATADDKLEGWGMRSATPGDPPCRAVRLGEAVDTQLLRSRNNEMVLIAGDPRWNQTGERDATLAIDGRAPIAVHGYAIGPIFMAPIRDAALEQQVRNARTLTWRLPWGEFNADVTGLGEAYDAITTCPG